MNKLFIRLFVAFVAFSFGLVLTGIVKPVHRRTRVVTIMVPSESMVSATEDEAQIREIYREYGPAQTRHDREFFERIETEDFTLSVGNMKLTREEDIRWMEGQPPDTSYESRVDHVTVFDNLAVAHGYLDVRHSEVVIRRWQFADVWIKRDNVWQILSTTSR